MNPVNRFIPAILICALMISPVILTSCGSSGKSSSDSAAASVVTAQETTTELTDGLPDTDMNGFTLNMLHHNDEWLTWAKIQLSAKEENGELINDAIVARNRAIEERFHCTLNLALIKQTASVFKNIVSAGDASYDIIFQYGLNVTGNAEFLSNFSELPYIDWDAEYWNPNATGVFKVGKVRLAAAGNLTLSYLSGSMCFLFNKVVYENFNVSEDFYGLADAGQWTSDKYFSAAKSVYSDLNGDGIVGKGDIVGTISQAKAYYNSMIIGAGFRYVTFDADHYPVFSLADDKAMLSFIQNIVDREKATPSIYPVTAEMLAQSYYPNASQGNSEMSFINGESLFTVVTPNGIEGANLREMEDDFGILPPPKRDESQDGYMTYANIGEIMTLPRSYDISRSEYIGMLLEAMSFYSQQHIVPAYKKTVLAVKLSRDIDSARMLDHIFSNIVFDYGTVVWESQITGPIITKYIMPRSDTLISTVETIGATVNTNIEKLLIACENVP